MRENDEMSEYYPEETVTCGFTVSVDEPENNEVQARSSYIMDDMSRLIDLNVFVYHGGVLLEDCCRYYRDFSSLMLSFPIDKDGFNIYLLGNVGKVEPPKSEYNLEFLCYMQGSFEDFKTKGVPLAGQYQGYFKGDLAHFSLKRLVGQYNISMRVSADDAQYIVKDLRLKNCARDLYPFANIPAHDFSCRCGSSACGCGDYLSTSDISCLNRGGTVSLYFIENLQGVLLPDNDDRKNKIPSTLELVQSGVSDRCTYLEVTADIVTPTAKYTDGKYRFYLGQDQTKDFSIKRNTLYNVTLDFTQNMISEEKWRIEVGEPDVVPVKLDKDEAMVVRGVEDMVYVQAYDNNGNLMDFDVEILSSKGYVNVQKVECNYCERSGLGKAMGLKFTSNHALEGLYSYGSEPDYKTETVRIKSKETYNGNPLYIKDIPVRVYYKLFPLLMKIEYGSDGTGGNSYNVVVRGRNPMGLGLCVETSAMKSGSGTVSCKSECFNQYGADGKVSVGAVAVAGIRCGSLGSSVKSPDDLCRVDFKVSGLSGGGSYSSMAYPRLQQSVKVFMGDGTEATVGPTFGDKKLSPESLPDLPDDDMFLMSLKDYSDGKVYYCGPIQDAYSKIFSKSSKVMDVRILSNAAADKYFEMGLVSGVGEVKYFSNQSHERCPFYFVNGGMMVSYCNVDMNCEAVKYPKYSLSTLSCYYYSPGRDLFYEKKGDDTFYMHESGYKVKYWRNLANKSKSEQVSKFYVGNFYMTINGSSTWVGADSTFDGYFTNEY